MGKPLYRLAVVVSVAIMLTACKTTDKTGASGERLSPEQIAAQDARTRGMRGGGDFRGSPLGGPGGAAGRIIYFELDSTDVAPQYRPIIEEHARYLSSNPKTVVNLEGHADERGSREYNVALGERRANEVRRQISLLGAGAEQLKTMSYGEEKPADSGHSEDAWHQNRRVEIIY
jgi:peptidoglycan-associated lipoprotein